MIVRLVCIVLVGFTDLNQSNNITIKFCFFPKLASYKITINKSLLLRMFFEKDFTKNMGKAVVSVKIRSFVYSDNYYGKVV